MAARADADPHHPADEQATASPLPTPVAAALGVVMTGVQTARQLPSIAPQLPMIGRMLWAQKSQSWRKDYLDFAARGEAFAQKMVGDAISLGGQAAGVVSMLRGTTSTNGVAETVAEGGRSVEEEAREVAEKARDAVEKATALRRGTSRPAGRKDAAAKPARKRTSAKPATPPQPDETPEMAQEAVEAGAPGAATEVAEQAEQQAPGSIDGDALSPDDLAIPDIDHLTLASLRARLRQLDVAQLVTLRAYEQAHADRLQVVTMLENRIAKLEADGQKAGPGAVSGDQQAAQQAAEPGMRQAESGADDLGATPRP